MLYSCLSVSYSVLKCVIPKQVIFSFRVLIRLRCVTDLEIVPLHQIVWAGPLAWLHTCPYGEGINHPHSECSGFGLCTSPGCSSCPACAAQGRSCADAGCWPVSEGHRCAARYFYHDCAAHDRTCDSRAHSGCTRAHCARAQCDRTITRKAAPQAHLRKPAITPSHDHREGSPRTVLGDAHCGPV